MFGKFEKYYELARKDAEFASMVDNFWNRYIDDADKIQSITEEEKDYNLRFKEFKLTQEVDNNIYKLLIMTVWDSLFEIHIHDLKNTKELRKKLATAYISRNDDMYIFDFEIDNTGNTPTLIKELKHRSVNTNKLIEEKTEEIELNREIVETF